MELKEDGRGREGGREKRERIVIKQVEKQKIIEERKGFFKSII